MKLKEKINLNKKQKIITGVVISVLLVGGIIGYSSMKQDKLEQEKMENMVNLYEIPGKEKIFMNGKVTPTKSEKIFVGADQGELDKIKVENGQYVEKGMQLFTCKNTSQINEISILNGQIAEKNKEKKNAPDQESKQVIDIEIKDLNKQIATLNKTAYQVAYAPFNGNVYLNDDTSSGDISKEVMTIQTLDFYIKGQVNERDSYKIALNEDVEITALATKDKYNGKITYIGDIPIEGDELSQGLSNDSGMTQYGVNISLDRQKNLKNGLHVQLVALYGSEYKKIPNSAILKEGDKKYVYKVSNKIAYKTEVTVSDVKEGFNLISRGIKEGDQIIQDIQGRDIKDGQEVYTSEDM